MIGRPHESGSMLLEVLIAFVILAAALILNVRILADGIRALETARERSAMLAVSRRELAMLELLPALKSGTLSGRDENGFAWTIDIGQRSRERVPSGTAVPFDVKVLVNRQAHEGAYPVSLKTILIALPER
jgi:Tfp pilus assembly protein PilV